MLNKTPLSAQDPALFEAICAEKMTMNLLCFPQRVYPMWILQLPTRCLSGQKPIMSAPC